MKASLLRIWWAAVGAGVTGCGGDEAHWAVQYAEVTPEVGRLEGTQVWTFYTERWGRNASEGAFVCSLSQQVRGTPVSNLDGCELCRATYALRYSRLDTDCPAEVSSLEGLEGLIGLSIGEVPIDLGEMDPYPGTSLGWYISLDGEVAEGHGYAFPISVLEGWDTGSANWVEGETYRLEPAFAWELDTP